MLKGKFTELSVIMKNLKIPHTSNLTAHMKFLEEKDVNTSERTRQQEIIKTEDLN